MIAESAMEEPCLQLQTMEQRTEQAETLNGLGEAAGEVDVCLEKLINRLMAASIQVNHLQLH